MLKTHTGVFYENFYLGSTSAIKRQALQGAFNQLGIDGKIVSLKVPSNVNEQPVGGVETCNGAVNRLTYLAEAVVRGGYVMSNSLRFAAENGILFTKRGDVIDKAFIMVSNANDSLMVESKSVVLSAKFAKPAVAHALSKPGGFEHHTVGQSLVELGFATSSDDWHSELCGVSRIQLLEDAFLEVIKEVVLKW